VRFVTGTRALDAQGTNSTLKCGVSTLTLKKEIMEVFKNEKIDIPTDEEIIKSVKDLPKR
jgi:TusA-related sulfurtransferase